MLKENTIKKLQYIIDAINEEDLDKLRMITASTTFKDITDNLEKIKKQIEEKKKEENLKKIFESYIKYSIENNLEKCMELYNYEDLKKLKYDVLKYVRFFASDEEIYEYTNAKSNNMINGSDKKNNIDNNREKCTKYNYVQEVLKLAYVNHEVLFKYYIENNISVHVLKHYVEKYSTKCNISEKEKQMIKNGVEEYSIYYNQYISQNKKKFREEKKKEFGSKVIKETTDLIKNIIDSKQSIKTYSDLNHINYKNLKTQLDRFKKVMPNEYEEFIKIVNENALNESKRNAQLAVIMNNMIINKIDDNNCIRDFDAVDYHLMTNLEIDTFLKSLKLTINDFSKILDLKKFLSKTQDEKRVEFHENYELNTNRYIFINGKNVEIPKEEKENIIRYLTTNNIPIDFSTYKALERRYVNKLKNNISKSI